MSSRFGTRTYGGRQKASSASLQFDQLFNDKNKPSAAKSAGTLHRWGKTSFTSLRNVHTNGQKEQPEVSPECTKRVKLDEDSDDPFSFDSDTDMVVGATGKLEHKAAPQLDGVKALLQPRPNKFFKSGSRKNAAAAASDKLFDSLKGGSGSVPSSHVMDRENIDTMQNISAYNNTIPAPSLEMAPPPTSYDPSVPASRIYKTYSSNNNNLKSSQSSVSTSNSYGAEYNESSSVTPSISSSYEEEERVQVIKKVPAKKIFMTYVSRNQEGESGIREKTVHYDHRPPSNRAPSPPITSPAKKTAIDLIKDDFDLSETESCDVPASIVESIQNDFEALLSDDSNKAPESTPQPPALPLPPSSDKDTMDLSDVEAVPLEQSDNASTKEDVVINSEEEDALMEVESVSEECEKPKFNLFRRPRKIFNSPKKGVERRALYKHRLWYDEADEGEEEGGSSSSQPIVSTTSKEFEFDDEMTEGPADRPAQLTRVTSWPLRSGEEPVTSVQCSKEDKPYFKVVRNVKQAHQCHESGETQEFNDDIDYLLDDLQSSNPVRTRCLSVISLASKCMAPAFRMHLRAHGTLSKVFSALENAPSDPNLALCTASAMFILSQDRLNMDLERESLELMLQLLETPTTEPDHDNDDDDMDEEVVSNADSDAASGLSADDKREFEKNKLRVRELCSQLQKKGHAKHLDLDNISAATLSMETLLSLTSRKAGEWFKEELRELGGLDHIVKTVCSCIESLDSLETLDLATLDRIRKYERCLRVLENVTFMNQENQNYLFAFNGGQFNQSSGRILRLLIRDIHYHPATEPPDKDSINSVLVTCLLSTFKVLLNITHENALGCRKVGEMSQAMATLLSCFLYLPAYIPQEQIFDLLVLSLGVIINMVEHCDINRRKFLEAKTPKICVSWIQGDDIPAVETIVNLFLYHEASAKREGDKTDSLLDSKIGGGKDKDKKDCPAPSSDEIEETLKKAIQKAGKHMENSMIAANAALLLGCAVHGNKEEGRRIAGYLPCKTFEPMVDILNKFLNFMSLTTAVTNTGISIIERVIDTLKNATS